VKQWKSSANDIGYGRQATSSASTRITRGLDYYTGPVMKTFVEDHRCDFGALRAGAMDNWPATTPKSKKLPGRVGFALAPPLSESEVARRRA